MLESRPRRRSVNARCSQESGEAIKEIAELIGWSESQIAGHLLDRTLPVLKKAYDEGDLLAILSGLRQGTLSIVPEKKLTTGSNENHRP